MKRFEIRLGKDLHEKLRRESFETEKSMHEIIIGLIEEYYEVKEVGEDDRRPIWLCYQKQLSEGR